VAQVVLDGAAPARTAQGSGTAPAAQAAAPAAQAAAPAA